MTTSTYAITTQSPPSYPDLAGKVAVITGASRGIGKATAEALAANGAHVALIARDRDALDRAAAGIGNRGGRAVVTPADCTDPFELQAAADAITRELGTPEILVAFAGG